MSFDNDTINDNSFPTLCFSTMHKKCECSSRSIELDPWLLVWFHTG